MKLEAMLRQEVRLSTFFNLKFLEYKMDKIKQLQGIGSKSEHCFFGGAGVSTESNIPDFRSSDGI